MRRAISLFILITIYSWAGYAAGIREDIIAQMIVWALTSFLILWVAISRGEFHTTKQNTKRSKSKC